MEEILEKIQEETSIIANERNIELITTFFKAHNLIPGVEVAEYKKVISDIEEGEDGVCTEKYYKAICIKYAKEDLHIGVILLNLTATHHGLNNMLIDYLHKLHVSPIQIRYTYTKPVTIEDVTNNFLTNVAPKLTENKFKKIPLHKKYAEIKGE